MYDVRFAVIVGLLVLASSFVACAAKMADTAREDHRMTPKTIVQVLKEHTEAWMSIPGVAGTGIGEFEGKPCIRVFVVEKTEELTRKIPSEVGGFPVFLEETGAFRALGPD